MQHIGRAAHVDEVPWVRQAGPGGRTVPPGAQARAEAVEQRHDAVLVQQIGLGLRIIHPRRNRPLHPGNAHDLRIGRAPPVTVFAIPAADHPGQTLAERLQPLGLGRQVVHLQVRVAQNRPLAGRVEVDRARRTAPLHRLLYRHANGRIQDRHGAQLVRHRNHLGRNGEQGAIHRRQHQLGVKAEAVIGIVQRLQTRALAARRHRTDHLRGRHQRGVDIFVAHLQAGAGRNRPRQHAHDLAIFRVHRVIGIQHMGRQAIGRLDHHGAHVRMRQLGAVRDGGKRHRLLAHRRPMNGRVADVDYDHRAGALVEDGIERLRDREAGGHGGIPELHRVPIGQHNHRRIDRAGRRRTDQPHHRRLDLANGARPLRNLDGLNAMQKIRCHGQSPFFLLAGLVASVARRCR